MRPLASLIALPILLASGTALRAQSPHMGFSLNLTFPTGAFASQSYTSYDNITGLPVIEKETYDVGFGGSFTVSFPMDRNLAMRLDLSGSTEYGHNRAAGYPTINLRHSMFSLGGDLQIFPQGTAMRHRGLYFVVGLAADFEQFDRSYGDPNPYYYYNDYAVDSTRKSRMGTNLGIGHTFGYDAGARFTLEATFHKTLTSHSIDAGDPPSTDLVRMAFGVVF